MSTAEILRKARALIDTQEKWTRETFARAADGMEVEPTDPRASCFCAMGAVYRVMGVVDPPYRAEVGPVIRALDAVVAPVAGIDWFNDQKSTAHADVLAAYDLAITLAEKEQTP